MRRVLSREGEKRGRTAKSTSPRALVRDGREIAGRTRSVSRPTVPPPRSNDELFNRSNSDIGYWSWNYRGCWHQACPPI